MDDLIDTTEAAALLHMTDRNLRYLLSSGQIKGQKIGRDWILDRESVLAYKAQRDAAGGPAEANEEK